MLSPRISSFLWFLLYEHPAFHVSTQHICRQNSSIPQSLQNWLVIPNSASAVKFKGNRCYFWLTAWHERRCLPYDFGTPSSCCLTESRLGFFSLLQVSTDLMSLSNCEACCFASYTPPEIKAGDSWCDVLIEHMQLISSYLLNQKIAGYFLLYEEVEQKD